MTVMTYGLATQKNRFSPSEVVVAAGPEQPECPAAAWGREPWGAPVAESHLHRGAAHTRAPSSVEQERPTAPGGGQVRTEGRVVAAATQPGAADSLYHFVTR